MFDKIFNIYVLKLLQNKYYVGKTTRCVKARYNEHAIGIGASWTKLYPPSKIVYTIQTMDKYDEDKWTKKYMGIYGIENVRGGSYSNVKLYDWQIKAIEYELANSSDLCYICKKHGHFASSCPNKNKQK